MKAVRFYKLVGLFLALVFAVSAFLPAVASAQRSRTMTIAEIAASNPDFSTLVAALDKAGLVGAVDGHKRLTVFAPTNDAFDALAVHLGYTDGMALVDALSAEQLTPILLYHVTNGNRPANSLFPPKAVRMLSGERAYTSVDMGDKFIADQPILATNIRAKNGFIHVIGGVMLPPAP